MVAWLLCCAAAVGGGQGRAWDAVREGGVGLGIETGRIDRLLDSCRQGGWTVEQAEGVLAPLRAAFGEQLPVEGVLLRIEEGLAKRVAWDEVRAAAQLRLEGLRKADALVMAVRTTRGSQHGHLVMHTCLAMESGISAEAFARLFGRPGGFRYGRLIHAIEAGETLSLEGMSEAQVLQIMEDCLDRGLTGLEVERMVEAIREGMRAGKDFETIHAALWVAPR